MEVLFRQEYLESANLQRRSVGIQGQMIQTNVCLVRDSMHRQNTDVILGFSHTLHKSRLKVIMSEPSCGVTSFDFNQLLQPELYTAHLNPVTTQTL